MKNKKHPLKASSLSIKMVAANSLLPSELKDEEFCETRLAADLVNSLAIYTTMFQYLGWQLPHALMWAVQKELEAVAKKQPSAKRTNDR